MSAAETWVCRACGMTNDAWDARCVVCRESAPVAPPDPLDLAGDWTNYE